MPSAARALLFASLLSVSVPQAAEDPRPRAEVGVVGSFAVLDDAVVGDGADGFEPAFGAYLSGRLFRQWDWYAEALFAEFETTTFRRAGDSLDGRAAVEFGWGDAGEPRWFVSGGVGWTEMTFDNALDFTSATASVGIGQRVPVGARTRLRWEVRASRTLAEDGFVGEDLTRFDAQIGLGWALGRVADGDADRVSSLLDRCPNTAPGVAVDRAGCPVVVPTYPRPTPLPPARPVRPPVVADADGDGIPDADDRCPRTLRGVEVDAVGCPRDDDGDGVHDGLGMDRCPDTPAGAKVDRHGCPLDGDGDGVWDGLDACPDTPAGARVDARGCQDAPGGAPL